MLILHSWCFSYLATTQANCAIKFIQWDKEGNRLRVDGRANGAGVLIGEKKLKPNRNPWSSEFSLYTRHTSPLRRELLTKEFDVNNQATKPFMSTLLPRSRLPPTSVAWSFLSRCFPPCVFYASFIFISGTSHIYIVSKVALSTLLKTQI